MLDEMRVLRDAAQEYRAAATAAGIAWPERADTQGAQPPDMVYRLFGVDHVAAQLSWLESQGWDSSELFPNHGQLQPWPTDDTAGESLDMLSLSVGTPFHWRHQIPIVWSAVYLYTFVLEGDHEGEIWRCLMSPDAWNPVRATPSLAALFTQWTRGIAAGVIVYSEDSRCLMVRHPTIPVTFDELWRRTPDLDPAAFPYDLPAPLLRERQRECGVDLDCIDRGLECWAELLDEVLALRSSLGL